MPDPFDVLRARVAPVMPDPDFAQRLRSRIERAFTLPKGVAVSNLNLQTRENMDTESERDVARQQAAQPLIGTAKITPYLAVSPASEAIEWYSEAFGAWRRGEPIVMPDGRIGHAEIEIGGALIMLADEFPDIGHTAPSREGGVAVTLHLSVEDVDSVIDRAVAAGADLERPAADFEYGRNGGIRDPFGHRWIISEEPQSQSTAHNGENTRQVTPVRHGDIGYVSLWLPDVARASLFFASVLGWNYAPSHGEQGRRVLGLNLHHGMYQTIPGPTLFLCFAVDDLDEATARVREAGGTAGEPREEPYGLISECVDDQGTQFALYEPPEGVAERDVRSVAPGQNQNQGRNLDAGNGDLAYITMEVVDSAKARAFYGSVLGWTFAAGHVEDGWQVEDVEPMVGLSGGNDRQTTVPMYRVDDINTAVERVRTAGGAASDPEHQPYGITSTCEDNQGTRFYLGQL